MVWRAFFWEEILFQLINMNGTSWDEIKHIVISLINDFYSTGKDCVIENALK